MSDQMIVWGVTVLFILVVTIGAMIFVMRRSPYR